MGIFLGKRNQLLKVLEWTDSSKDIMVYKHPMEGAQIMMGSKLVVRESQIAVFLNKGKLCDVFGPGTHTLDTSNMPILTKLMSWPFGFKSPFLADVYFVNTKQFTNQKWGTTNPITMRDKDFGTIRIRAYGSYAFRVDDAVVFLRELFGSNSSFSTEDISSYLRSMLVSNISDSIAESKVGALDLACNLQEFNKIIAENVATHFTSLGLKITNLIIENVSFPENVEKAIDERSSMGVLKDSMDTYMKYQTAQAVRDAAKNQGMGGMGASIGTGMAMGEMMKQSMKTVTEPNTPASDAGKKFCSNCGAEIKSNAKFCPECGTKQNAKPVCPKCGVEVKPTSKFCPECGTKLK